MMRKPFLTALVFAAASLLATTSCSSEAAQSAPEVHPTAAITLYLDWHPCAQFAGFLTAFQNGYYRAEGLDITITPADEAMDPFALIAHTTNTIGISEADSLLSERAKGVDIRAFATMMQTTPFSLFTLKESGLTTFKSLKGKRIGLYGDGRRAIDELINFNHMANNDVTLADIPFSLDPLITGQVDAMQGYTIDEGVRLKMQHHPVNTISMADNGYVSYAEVLFASSALVHQHPETLVRFLRATRKGWEYAAAHQAETATMIVAKYLPTSSFEEQSQSLALTIPLLNAETHDHRFGQMQPATWQKSFAMFQKYQAKDAKIAPADLVDYSILEKIDGKKP